MLITVDKNNFTMKLFFILSFTDYPTMLKSILHYFHVFFKIINIS